MGQELNKSVIGLEFSSLTMEPQAFFELGREDITKDRPGHILIEEVKKFQAQGGFRHLQELRDKEAGLEMEKDAFIGKRNLDNFQLAHALQAASENDMKKDGDTSK